MPDFDSFDALTEVPEERALAVELSGNTFPWLPEGLAIKRAEDRGWTLGEILEQLEVLDELADAEGDEDADIKEVADTMSGVYPAVARLTWFGFLQFDETVEYDAVLGIVGPSTLSELPIGEMMNRVFPGEDEELPEGEDEGK